MADDLVVRVGVPDDVHEIMNLAMLATEENGVLEPSEYKLLEHIWAALNQVQGIVGVVSRPGGKPEGAVLLRIGSLWYSDQEVVEEKAIFIHPEFRAAKGGRAKKLCEFSKQVSDTLGIPLMIGVLSNQRTEAKVRMYERQFGPPSGAFWLYGAKTGRVGNSKSEEASAVAPVS